MLRERWLAKAQQGKARAVVTSPTAMSANVRKVLMSSVRYWQRTVEPLGSVLLAAARKAAETFAKMPGSKVMKARQAHRAHDSEFKRADSWDEKGNPIPFTLNVLN